MHGYHVIERKQGNSGLPANAPQGRGSAVGWRDTAAVMDGDQLLMAVAIGPDGMVWSYRAAETRALSASAPSQEAEARAGLLSRSSRGEELPDTRPVARAQLRCTHLCADTITVSFDADERPVVFAASGLEVQYATCLNVAEMQWTAPRSAPINAPSDAQRIERILSRRMEGKLHVGAMLRMPGEDGPLYNAAYASWDTACPEFRHTPVYVESLERLHVSKLLLEAADSLIEQAH